MIKTTQLKIQPKAGKNLIYVCGPYRNTSEEKKMEQQAREIEKLKQLNKQQQALVKSLMATRG